MFTARLTNYRGFADATLDLGEGITVLVGGNSQGKTGLANGVAAVLTGTTKLYDVNKESAAAELISAGSGASVASVALQAGESSVAISWPAGQMTSDGPGPFPTAGAVVAGLLNPRTMDRKTWLQFVTALCKLGPISDDELRAAGADDDAVKTFRSLAGQFDAAEKHYREAATKAKGVWEHIAGRRWGDKLGPAWGADGIMPDLPQDPMEIEGRLARLRKSAAEREAEALRIVAESRARSEMNAGEMAGLRARAASLTPAREVLEVARQKLDQASMDLRRQSQALQAMPADGGVAELVCPECKTVLRLDGNQLVKHRAFTPAEGRQMALEIAAARQRLEDRTADESRARTAFLTAQTVLGAAREAQERLAELEKKLAAEGAPSSAGDDQPFLDDTELVEIREEIARLEPHLAALVKTQQARHHAAAVQIALATAQVFSPTGVRRDRIVRALEPVNARLADLGAMLFGKSRRDGAPQIDASDDAMPLVFGGRTQDVIAWRDDENSTSLRLRFLLQVLAWERFGGDLVIMDRADILEPGNRVRLLKALRAAGVPSLVVFTSDQPERAAGLLSAGLADRVYVVGGGKVEPLAAQQQRAA